MNRLPERLRRFEVDEDSGCWNWAGSTANGYGTVGKGKKAARVIYAVMREEIPGHLDLHHECRNKACVNPDHLTPLTRAEHLDRHHFRHAKQSA